MRKFFNTSGILYRQLKLKDKLSTMVENDQYEILATDGLLVKRPLLIDKKFILVGFKEVDWIKNLASK